MFSNSSMSATRISPFQIHPAINAHLRKYFWQNFLVKWMMPGLVSRKNRITFNQLLQEELLVLLSGSPNRLSKGVFPICQEVLNISQIAIAFHIIGPPLLIHPNLIASVQLTFPLLICVPPFQQYHSSQIDGVSKFDDSMIDLQRICQIPMNCQCKLLSFFLTARETLLHSLRLHPLSGKILYHDCVSEIVEIHLPH